jgi:hypothetical protein
LCSHEDVLRKTLAILGSATFLVLAPGFMAGMVPSWISHWRLEDAFPGLPLLRIAGGLLLALGATDLIDSFGPWARHPKV